MAAHQAPRPWDLQARTLEWVAISFSNALKWKVKSESEVTQSCPTLSDPMDCNPPVPSDYGVFQARILEGTVISFSRGSFQPRDWTCIASVSCIVGIFFTQACLWILSKWKSVAFHNYIWTLGLSFLTRNQGKKGFLMHRVNFENGYVQKLLFKKINWSVNKYSKYYKSILH